MMISAKILGKVTWILYTLKPFNLSYDYAKFSLLQVICCII